MQVISIGHGGEDSNNVSGILGILGISPQLETALAVGREQTRKLRDDVLAMQARHQQTEQRDQLRGILRDSEMGRS